MVSDSYLERQAQHAGVFYPINPKLLRRQLDDCFGRCHDVEMTDRVKAIVVPHAGYDYSAHVAAQAYAALPNQDWVQRIVILGPNHQTAIEGGLIGDYDSWATPFGAVKADRDFIKRYWEPLSCVAIDNSVHQTEYSIEVQLPFIQRVLPGVPIASMLLGACTELQIADILQPAWECEDTLIIISSDLYHYLPRVTALSAGVDIARMIEAGEHQSIGPEQACGYVALSGLMQFTRPDGVYWRTLLVSHSGHDSRFSDTRLVGYGAFLLCVPSVGRVFV